MYLFVWFAIYSSKDGRGSTYYIQIKNICDVVEKYKIMYSW